MAFEIENFQASSDIKNYTEGELKALLKRRYGLTAKKSKEVYNMIHGKHSPVSGKAESDKQP